MRGLVIILVTLLSCRSVEETRVIQSEWNTILEEYGVKGATVLYYPEQNKLLSNDFTYAEQGTLPASTFKIPNTIIGLETGILSDTSVFRWDGVERQVASWNQDLILKDAFRYSCVPCYRQLARSIGVDTMNNRLNKLKYPGMDVTEDNIDLFWLRGDSKINLLEQVDFITRLTNGQLPIHEHTVATLKSIMINDKSDTYVLRGKTGLANDNNENIGWYVGYIRTNNRNSVIFATRVEPLEGTPISTFRKSRMEITKAILTSENLITQ